MGAISEVSQILRKANDLLEVRLDKRARDIATSRFIELGHPETLPLHDFLELQEKTARQTAFRVNLHSQEMESATDELIHLLTQSYSGEEMMELRGDCVGLLAQYQKMAVDRFVFTRGLTHFTLFHVFALAFFSCLCLGSVVVVFAIGRVCLCWRFFVSFSFRVCVCVVLFCSPSQLVPLILSSFPVVLS